MSSSTPTVGVPQATAPQGAAHQAAAGEAPPAQDGWPGGLPALRAELDRIDNQIHALLIERAQVVEHVARSGKPAAFRPGREAAIVRRLLAQHHGRLPPVTLFRMWREMLAGTTAMQGPFTAAVAACGSGDSLTQLAREHLGALTPLRVLGTAAQALNEVRSGGVAVAVLPLPTEAAASGEAWWTTLLEPQPLYIIARLPFWGTRSEGATTAQALMVAASPPDASGEDRSYLAFKLDADLTRPRITSALTAAGLPPRTIVLHREPGASVVQALVEVDGALSDDDARLPALARTLSRPTILGFYAMPVGPTA
jgi:chorismate mutase/prephenate dehydratase